MAVLEDLTTVRVRTEGTVAHVTLERGERNMLDAGMTKELTTALRTLDDDETIGAIVLTGAGGHV
ncbi:enoyl-CoA hydratase/isomerase, partial [Arthrobacter crystallopoietes BAB-32]